MNSYKKNKLTNLNYRQQQENFLLSLRKKKISNQLMEFRRNKNLLFLSDHKTNIINQNLLKQTDIKSIINLLHSINLEEINISLNLLNNYIKEEKNLINFKENYINSIILVLESIDYKVSNNIKIIKNIYSILIEILSYFYLNNHKIFNLDNKIELFIKHLIFFSNNFILTEILIFFNTIVYYDKNINIYLYEYNNNYLLKFLLNKIINEKEFINDKLYSYYFSLILKLLENKNNITFQMINMIYLLILNNFEINSFLSLDGLNILINYINIYPEEITNLIINKDLISILNLINFNDKNLCILLIAFLTYIFSIENEKEIIKNNYFPLLYKIYLKFYNDEIIFNEILNCLINFNEENNFIINHEIFSKINEYILNSENIKKKENIKKYIEFISILVNRNDPDNLNIIFSSFNKLDLITIINNLNINDNQTITYLLGIITNFIMGFDLYNDKDNLIALKEKYFFFIESIYYDNKDYKISLLSKNIIKNFEKFKIK